MAYFKNAAMNQLIDLVCNEISCILNNECDDAKAMTVGLSDLKSHLGDFKTKLNRRAA